MSRVHYMHVWKWYGEMLTLCHYENPVFDTKKTSLQKTPLQHLYHPHQLPLQVVSSPYVLSHPDASSLPMSFWSSTMGKPNAPP